MWFHCGIHRTEALGTHVQTHLWHASSKWLALELNILCSCMTHVHSAKDAMGHAIITHNILCVRLSCFVCCCNHRHHHPCVWQQRRRLLAAASALWCSSQMAASWRNNNGVLCMKMDRRWSWCTCLRRGPSLWCFTPTTKTKPASGRCMNWAISRAQQPPRRQPHGGMHSWFTPRLLHCLSTKIKLGLTSRMRCDASVFTILCLRDDFWLQWSFLSCCWIRATILSDVRVLLVWIQRNVGRLWAF